jgi:hypothetical protein
MTRLLPVIPDGAMRADGGQRSDPGPREAGSDSFREVPDSLASAALAGRRVEAFETAKKDKGEEKEEGT